MNHELPRESRRARTGAWRLAAAYFVIATLWILGSDHIAAFIARDAHQLRTLQSLKGMVFVIVMTVLVGVSATRVARAEAARQREQAFASIDPVTQLPNARAFYAAVADALGEGGPRCALLLLDVRGFARINATFGRHGGDQVLFNVGRRLCVVAGELGIVARLEEDKFGILIPIGAAADAEELAENAIARFRNEMRFNGRSVLLNVNVGYAVCGEDGDHVAGLLDAADLALRAAKESGHNLAQRFNRELLQARREHFHLEAELREAIAAGRLVIHLQPQFDLVSGSLDSAEALVRWTHPERGPIHPAVFVAVAEQSGLIDRLGEHVLHLACGTMRAWRDANIPGVRIAVNIAGHQLDDQRLGFYLQQAADEAGVPLSSLEIEITETMAMRSPEAAIEVLGHLRELGVTVALDDFGTGYSSLSYLLQLPVDKLKIDRSFISSLDKDLRQRAFVQTLIHLGRDLGMRVVAEGIETEAQRGILRELGCELGQGYLLGAPMSVEAFTQLLRTTPVTGRHS